MLGWMAVCINKKKNEYTVLLFASMIGIHLEDQDIYEVEIVR
jgi:hypothetical protein